MKPRNSYHQHHEKEFLPRCTILPHHVSMIRISHVTCLEFVKSNSCRIQLLALLIALPMSNLHPVMCEICNLNLM